MHAFARREHELEAVPRQRLVYPAPQGVAGIREVAYDGRAYTLLTAELEKALYALHRINWLRGAPAKVLELLIGHVELKPQALVDGQVQLEAVRLELERPHLLEEAGIGILRERGERRGVYAGWVLHGVAHDLRPAGGVVLNRLIAERMPVIKENHFRPVHWQTSKSCVHCNTGDMPAQQI